MVTDFKNPREENGVSFKFILRFVNTTHCALIISEGTGFCNESWTDIVFATMLSEFARC